jgi:hypothetical protein
MAMPSENYHRALKATQALHANSTKRFTGRFLVRYLDDVRGLVKEHRARTLCDYGAGKGVVWKETPLAAELGLTGVFLYDPGVPEYSREPTGKFDMVICTQALGSIPVSDLPWVIDRLYSLASKVVYVGEKLGPVRKQIHRDMADAGLMPHGWSRERWVMALRRPNASVPLYLRTNDKVRGESVLGRVE